MATHKTAMGKPIDMASIRAKNPTTRAVGNMNVNARGDIIDSHDNVISDVTKRVNQNYMRTVINQMDPSMAVRPTRTPTAPAQRTQLQPDVEITEETVLAQPTATAEPEFSAEEQQFDAEDIFEDPKPKKTKK